MLMLSAPADVILPEMHMGQRDAFYARTRYQAMRCGRRWGKTDYSKILTGDRIIQGQNVGIFVPTYKIQSETYAEITEILDPIRESSSKGDWVFRANNGGRIDFWTLENERAGRGRKYDLAIVDEAAFTKPNMMHMWETAIEPTLVDRGGDAIVMSTPNGIDLENFFYQVCTQKKHGFTEFHAPTADNPYIPEAKLAEFKAKMHPLVYRQEVLAEFVDWSGETLFDVRKLLVNGRGIDVPQHIDYVYATIDTAVKDGQEHDSTAVVYWGRNSRGVPATILDWDIIQIEGSLLETWLPAVYVNLEAFARETKAIYGSAGCYIEDKASGTILLQQALRRGWQAEGIDSTFTALGKDARALNMSGYVYSEQIKITEFAYNKTKEHKGTEMNHLLYQVGSFVIGDKLAAKRADDLLDAFVYGISVAMGNNEGF
jgi:hypothetical protein